MPRSFKSVSGFVLGGGASRRMGRPKALLVIGGETMIERQVRLLGAVAREVFVAGWLADLSKSKLTNVLRDLPFLPDELASRGPLGGIYTGLMQSRSEYNLFLGCDMPFVDGGFLEFLCRRALESRADVTVPKSRERWLEPLCAVYRRRAVDVVRDSLASGENKITRFFPRVRCEVIPWREIARAGFAPTIFDNINTPEEYGAAKRILNYEC
jgi:molybdopterin-guanine dinucleotide biosynthesis protein A